MRTESLASSQSGRNIHADAWCKRSLRCTRKDAKLIEGIGRDTCLIYQIHPLAYAELKMDYLDNTLVTHVVRECVAHIKLPQRDNKFLQMNFALMSVHQNEKRVSF